MLQHVVPVLALSCAVSASALAAPATADDTTVSDLELRIAELEQRLARAEADDTWLAEQRADEVRGLVSDVLADADTRASLLQSGSTAGYNNGFFLSDAAGNNTLNVAGRIQFRYVYSRLGDDVMGREQRGFENRRTRLTFKGNIFNKNLGYQIQGDFSRSSGTFSLLDAYINYKMDNGMSVRFGQFRPAFMFEDSTSSSRQLAAERSLVANALAQGRTQGVQLSGSGGDNFRWYASFTDGIPSLLGAAGGGNNTAWNQGVGTTEFALTGRVEYLGEGSWSQFRDFSSWDGEEFAWMIGGGAHWQRDRYGVSMDPKVEVFRWTADASFKFGGASAFAAVVGNHEKQKVDGGTSEDQFAFVLQGGVFFVPDQWEGFARYEWGDADRAGIEDLTVITVGVNRYFNKHNLKWTTDIGYGFMEVGDIWSSGGAGWRTDPVGEDGQVVIRSMVQLVF